MVYCFAERFVVQVRVLSRIVCLQSLSLINCLCRRLLHGSIKIEEKGGAAMSKNALALVDCGERDILFQFLTKEVDRKTVKNSFLTRSSSCSIFSSCDRNIVKTTVMTNA